MRHRAFLFVILLIVSSNPAAMAQRAQSRTIPDYRILLETGTFDPAAEQRNLGAQAFENAPAYYIVQFQTTPSEQDRHRLREAYGLRLTEFIPNFAYIEKLVPETLQRLTADPLYRAHVPYRAQWKVSPRIGTLRFRTEERRAMRGVWLQAILFNDADPDAFVRAAKENEATRIDVVDERKFGGSLRVTAIFPSAEVARSLAQLPEVRWIEEVPERNYDNGTSAGTLQSGTPGTIPIWNAGIHGEGQIIGVIDGTIDINHCALEDNTDNTIRSAHRKMVGLRGASGTDDHGTFVAGIVAGDDFNNPGTGANRGMAWAARLTSGTSSNVLTEFGAARADGAHIHTNSWHNDDLGYPQLSADVDSFVWNNEDALVLGSSGNVGESIGPPGTAKNALCVSAAARAPSQNNFGDGNSGPTNDNRRKPEIFAPGCTITSVENTTPCNFTVDATVFGFGPICATSWATPATAGAAALVRQYYTEGWYPTGTRQPHDAFVPTGALLKATLINGTLDMTGMPGYPGNMEGWGLLRLDNVLQLPGSARNLRVWDTPNGAGFFSGAPVRTHVVNVATNTQQLRVTMVYTDAPAAANAAVARVNDLDLTVTSPNGAQTFRGNVFAGGVSTTGGTADDDNNVEMVVVNNPAPGNWTLTIAPTTISVGTQGYALIATADMPDVPAPTGNQNTLVVRVKFSDIVAEPSLPNLQTKMITVANNVNTVTYEQTTIVPEFRGPVNLENPTTFYYHPTRNLLIEMTQEVVQKLVAADANVFTKGTADPNDDIDRMILVTNDEDFNEDWATTGAWPYDLPGGFTRPISVSIQSAENNDARFVHGLEHQFGLVDLYAHPGVTFPRAYADEWDNMARPFRGQHPLVWSKERARWVTTHGDIITYVPRPTPPATFDQTFQVDAQESTATNRKAIAIGLTPNRPTLDVEGQFYVVEVRDQSAALESSLPSSGVLIYLVNELIPQGQGTVILRDPNAGTPKLEAFTTSASDITIPGTGITINVVSGSGGGPYNIRVRYTPPATNFNLRITRGDTINGQSYSWFSPDIWLDSPLNGENLAAGPPPNNAVERPMVGMVNKIRVRIFNDGPATAENFDVRLRISEPFHTVGGQADFDTVVGIIHVDGLVPTGQPVPPGMLASGAILTFDWTPTNTGAAHSCAWAEFINVPGNDTNANDNSAQENLEKITSVNGSPFHPTNFHFDIENPYAEPALFYFRVDGAPANWSIVKTPEKAMLNPGQSVEGDITITPPDDDKLLCTSRILEVTAWTPRGDTLIPVGGSVVQVDMRRPTELTLDVDERLCGHGDSPALEIASTVQRCRRIVARGCTDPPLPNQLIWVKYTSSTGETVWHQVMTDANGCFEDFIITADSSVWSATAGFEGDDCQGPAEEGPRQSGGQGLFPPVRGLWYSVHLGHNFPLGTMRNAYASGPSITIDFEYPYREIFSFYAMAGYHYFDAKMPGSNETYLTNLSFNVRWYGSAGAWRPFVGIGPGLYRFEGGSNNWGLNAALGLEFPIVTNFSVETGADYHFVNSTPQARFIDAKLGIKWRF